MSLEPTDLFQSHLNPRQTRLSCPGFKVIEPPSGETILLSKLRMSGKGVVGKF